MTGNGKKWGKGVGPLVQALALHSSSISVTGALTLILESQVPVAGRWAWPVMTEEIRV